MKKLSLFSAPLAFAALLGFGAVSAQASSSGEILQQRLKASYNTMVQDVRQEESPEVKREIINRFLTRMDKGLALVEKMADQPTRTQATLVRDRIQADIRELGGMDARLPASAGNFNSFAAYLQQDVEQADGIYLSVGAVIIILLILIILL